MKKLFLTILATLSVALLIPAATFAASATTDVTGTVTNNGNVVSGAKVTVVCDNNSKKTSTDSSGAYLVTFKAANCPDSSKATVVATKGGKGGVSTGTVSKMGSADLNVAIVNVALPEFGIITGIGAAVIGGGAFFLIRRRQLGGSEN
jgi:hypothetical protein